MSKELKKKLYIMFASMTLLMLLVPSIYTVVFRMCYRKTAGMITNQTVNLLNMVCFAVCIVASIIELIWISKYKVLKSQKIIAVVVLGIISVIVLCGIDLFRFVTLNHMELSLRFYFRSGCYRYLSKHIAFVLGIVGLCGTFKAKEEDEIKEMEEAKKNYWSAQERIISDNQSSSKNASDIVRKSIYNKYCEEVKKSLKAPASAVFCNIDDLVIQENDNEYIVKGWVDSQNTYGAMIRTNVNLKMAIENGNLVSKTNLRISASGKVAGQLIYYYIIGAILAAISFFFFYFVITEML